MNRSQPVALEPAEPERSHWVERAREILGASLARAWPVNESLRREVNLPQIHDHADGLAMRRWDEVNITGKNDDGQLFVKLLQSVKYQQHN